LSFDLSKISKEYQEIFDTRPNFKFDVKYAEPEKLAYGEYAYDIKLRGFGDRKMDTHMQVPWKFNKMWKIMQAVETRCLTQEEQKQALAVIVSLLPKKNKSNFIIDIYLPQSEAKLKRLQELNAISGKFKKTYLDKPPVDGIYTTKITVETKYDWMQDTQARKDIFLNNFEKLYQFFNNEQISPLHKFSKHIVNEYERTKLSRQHHIYSITFTLLLADETDLDMLFMFFNKNFRVKKVLVHSGETPT
jgi:hypothetical protein